MEKKQFSKQLIIFIIIVLVVGAGCFYAGTKLNNNSRKQFPIGQGNFNGQGNRVNAGQAKNKTSAMIGGEIVKKDDQSITIKLMDGGSKTVYFATSTQVAKSVDGTLADLSTGINVMVSGKTGTDGSVSAQYIQIRPALPNQLNANDSTNTNSGEPQRSGRMMDENGKPQE
ncbi:MAG: hypothetical protein PHR00_03960 [Patescibacteria group bacterium]|nr:hypothetical protein [Patescibacteria group bacterium]